MNKRLTGIGIFLVLLLVVGYLLSRDKDPTDWDGIILPKNIYFFSPRLNWVTAYGGRHSIELMPLPNVEDKVEIDMRDEAHWELDEWMPDGTGFLVHSFDSSEDTVTWWLMKVNNFDERIPLCTLPDLHRGGYRMVNWSPDGTAFILLDRGGDARREHSGVTIVHTDGSGCEELPEFGLFWHDVDFSWSPDGQRIVYSYRFRSSEYRRSSSLPETQILDLSTYETSTVYAAIGSPIWFPDGDRIALRFMVPDEELPGTYDSGEDILVVHADGSGLIKDVELPDGYRLADNWRQGHSWSPDGSRLAIALWKYSAPQQMAIGVLDSDDLTLLVLDTWPLLGYASFNTVHGILGWTPDGSALVISSVRSMFPGGLVLREIPVAP